MDTLVSLKNTYSDFKQSYEIDLMNAKGELKNSLKYGEFYKLPIKKNLIVFYLANQKELNTNIIQVLNNIAKNEMSDQFSFVIIAGKKVPIDNILEKLQKTIVYPSNEKAVETFASAEYIIANGNLPPYFVKKEEQKVIQIFDELDYKSAKNKNSRNRISWMLNSSVIFIEKDNKETFIENYKIPEEYIGRIKTIISKEKLSEQVLNELNNTNVLKKIEKKKKNILIVASSWNLRGHEKTYIKLIADNINYDKYDLTLVLKRPTNGNSEEELQSINERIRIIYRKGTFSCTKEEYIRIQYLLKNFDAFKEIQKAYDLLDKKVVQRECKRILGDMEFSEVIYIGKHSAVWSVFTEEIKSQHKIRIINHDLQEELYGYTTEVKQLGFYNKLKLYDDIFEQIIFTDSKFEEKAVAEKYFSKAKVASFEFPNRIYGNQNSRKSQYVEYHGKKYFMGQQYEYLHGGMSIVLFPVPRKNQKAYIANGNLSDKELLIKMFLKLYEQDHSSLLVIYGKDSEDIRQYAKQYGIAENIEIIEQKTLETVMILGQYLENFEGCLITGKREEYCLISTLMELIGKRLITYKNGILMECKEVLFKNLDEYNIYVQERWNQFLNANIKMN